MLTWNDFENVEMRVGTIVEVNEFPKANKPAYQLKIDFGPSGVKQSSAQITHHYSPLELIGKQVVAVVNFPPKQIANFFSECLVLGVYDMDNRVILLEPGKIVANGQRVS